MDLQKFADQIQGNASIYAFDRLPDGTFSEIRMMAANEGFAAMFRLNPNAPEFYPGIPYRKFFQDLNFESFCYRCGSTGESLTSYVNAHGAWLSGIYFPIISNEENTFYCCYVLKISREPESEVMSKRSSDIVSAVLNITIKLNKTRDFMLAMTDTVKEIKKVCDSEICSILLVNKNEQKCSFIGENGMNQKYLCNLAESMNRTPYEMAMSWEKALKGTDCFLLNDFSFLKELDFDWYQSLMKYQIKSMVLYSIHFNKELVGFIWAANFDVEKIMHIKETLELTTFFIGAYIANHQLLDKLEVMSMVDMLTGVRNRNAMNKRVDQSLSGEVPLPSPMGVVFADINGLKTVNDNEGHDAGDRLLKKAAVLLKIAFGAYEIYRAGGDEFVIFCPEITQQELDNHIAELRKISEDTEDVRLAIGSSFSSGTYDICHAMQAADERMYLDKQEFYRLHPEKKRRA